MNFVQSCFIRKNSAKLRNLLEQLGYRYAGRACANCKLENLYCIDDRYYECTQKPSRYHSIVDCGENEELFIALASLRKDSDKWQWFWSSGWTNFDGDPLPDKWILCDQETLENFAWVNNSPNSYDRSIWKKATPIELIQRFGN